jgi:hypothetical protein
VRLHKYWPPVKRVDQVFGDTHFFCECPTPGAWDINRKDSEVPVSQGDKRTHTETGR